MAYAIGIIHEEDGAFGISFPDFPGAISTGTTLDEAVRKGEQALALHIEGMEEDKAEFPRLRGLAELQASEPEALSGGAAVYVPVQMPARYVRVNITMDDQLLSRIDAAATAAGESRSAYLAGAARARIGR